MIVKIIVFIAGLFLVSLTIFSAIKSFVMPRSIQDPLARFVFNVLRKLFLLRLKHLKTYQQRDQLLAFFAPVGLLLMVPTWYLLVFSGYVGMFWAAGAQDWYIAFRDSGSSLFTLGFAAVDGNFLSLLAFSEAGFGLMLVAVLIAYLPTMYSAFSRREVAVTLLEVRAGNPPSAVEMLNRYQRIHGLDRLAEEWVRWETWFAEIEESHSSLAALVFFRSPRPQNSWVNAAGTVLDAASLRIAVIDLPEDPQAALCIRAGYLALRHISDFFSIPYKTKPLPGDPISISREQFESACQELAAVGVPLKPDLNQAWLAYSGWRVNYDSVLLALARLTAAPAAPWILTETDDKNLFRL